MPKKSRVSRLSLNCRNASVKSPRTAQTVGQIFPDNSVIELVRPFEDGPVALLLSSGQTHFVRTRVTVGKRVFCPPGPEDSLFKVMRFPRAPRDFGSVPKLLGRISALFTKYSGFSAEYAGMLARFVLSTWIADRLPVRPRLHFLGPPTSSGLQALELLECISRHPVRLAKIDVGAVAGIPPGLRPTIIIQQHETSRSSRELMNFPDDRAGILKPNGRFVPIEFTAVTYSESPQDAPAFPSSLVVPVLAAEPNRPVLSSVLRNELAAEFQDQQLAYRLQMLPKLSGYEVRDANFSFGFADLARCLMLCTPENADLQAEVSAFLQERAQSARVEQSATPNATVAEAVLFCVHEGHDRVQVKTIADVTNEIFRRRGEIHQLQPRAVGNVLRNLGLEAKDRDSSGIGLILLREVRRFIHQLARDLNVPSADCQPGKCDLCIASEHS